jgi:aspartyl-tRNA(Asn)/glutamyl-tRNA(Gln) amidotransferase subunit B
MNKPNKFEPVIGFEIHVELATRSKMFCGCKNDPFFAKSPNSYTCPVCLGLPGALPVPNKKAVEWTIMLGLALGCRIPLLSKFDRKHYFYPDLPKGYQISQYDQPLAVDGKLGDIRIKRVHLEEDTAKMIHETVDGEKVSLIDFNRSGVPLVEIVTEPDLRSADESKEFLKRLPQIIRYLGISDADMEKGSMRLEPNISVRKVGSRGLPSYKVEVKNINSFNFAKKAIDYEVVRQMEILKKGKTPLQENRGWNEEKGVTVPQRTKEEAADYRYFPDPDIPPMRWTQSTITTIQSTIPELPEAKAKRFEKNLGLSAAQALAIVESHKKSAFFEEAVAVGRKYKQDAKTVANWMINRQVDIEETLPAQLIEEMVKAKKVVSLTGGEMGAIVSSVIEKNPKAVADYKKGKEQSIMFLLGQVQRELKGKAPVSDVIKMLKGKLG